MIYLTEEQYKKVLEAKYNPINEDYIQQFLSEVREFEEAHPEVKTYELS
jgi:hypothetical protein